MKGIFRFITFILCFILSFSSIGMVANAKEFENKTTYTLNVKNDSNYSYTENNIIGEYDGPINQVNNISPFSVAANVRINSYATYDSENGINIYVKLYCPLYPIFNPKFTSMAGQTSVKINDKTTKKNFTKSANKSSTIEKTVKTGIKAKSLTKGKVSVSGLATAEEALNGGGAFSISYDIQIP